ncbi:hypothetical protein QT381_06445 [Galbitalea sp. SE-J8]|uniref:hypothetical protein n=1 Tax=Galbitalea sp. SE-J8 TaxID=3054952 RepID=UPI00259CB97D|nr:hypothetical protein [Galbitalea sp. SE-J8]MDM4762642.1 hypothetical protein [Galbitalea sp. SE-J8]
MTCAGLLGEDAVAELAAQGYRDAGATYSADALNRSGFLADVGGRDGIACGWIGESLADQCLAFAYGHLDAEVADSYRDQLGLVSPVSRAVEYDTYELTDSVYQGKSRFAFGDGFAVYMFQDACDSKDYLSIVAERAASVSQ